LLGAIVVLVAIYTGLCTIYLAFSLSMRINAPAASCFEVLLMIAITYTIVTFLLVVAFGGIIVSLDSY
jgi:hypothetical protein